MADLVRGKTVEQALNILTFSPKRARRSSRRLSSQPSPTPSTTTAPISTLRVKTIYVEQGMTLKRFTARAKGPRQSHQQADLPYLRDGRGKEIPWDRKSIRPASVWRSRVTGALAGLLLVATFRRCSTRTSGSRASEEEACPRFREPCCHRASGQNARITVFSARPGVVIGKKGEDIES